MRKIIVGFIAGVIMATSISVYADEGIEKIEAYVRKDLPITLDGRKVELDNPAVMVEGSTYLKLRDVGKITGVGVDWNEATQTVVLTSQNATTIKAASGGGVTVPVLSDMQRQILELKEQIRSIPLLIDNLKRSIEMAKIDLARNPNDETAKNKIVQHEARIKEYESIKAGFEQELAQLEAQPTP